MTIKRYFKIALFALLAFIVYKVASWFVFEPDRIDAFHLVPHDAMFIIETREPISNLEILSQSELWDHLQSNEQIALMSEKLNSLDSLFQSERNLFNKIGDRDLIISAHKISFDDYGFLYLADLRQYSKIDLIKNNISQLVNENYSVSKREFKGHVIQEILDTNTNEVLRITFIENQLVASYTPRLVERSITTSKNPKLSTDLNFIKVKNEIQDDGLFRFYLNHNQLSNYYGLFVNESSDIIDILESNFYYSGFQIEEESDRWLKATGYISGNSTAQAFIKALDNSGTGSLDATTILPNDTALYISFGFDDFQSLHQDFISILKKQENKTVEEYENGKKKIEEFLDIDLDRDMYSWWDDEFAFATLDNSNNSNYKSNQESIIAAIKYKDEDVMQERLRFVQEQIRKKSPVLFKTVNYKQHAINFLDIKGFFKWVLGGMFERIEKPYYTVIDDYIVFSNSPVTLKKMIDDYEGKNTLIYSDYYMDFIDEFSTQSNVFFYIDTNKLAHVGSEYLNKETQLLLNKQHDFYSQFTQLGFELKANEDLFKTRAVMRYDPDYDNQVQELEQQVSPGIELVRNVVNLDKETIFQLDLFPSDFTASDYEQFYSNGQLKFKVPLSDGLPNGRYREYYITGELKISGRFKRGKQIGKWKAFYPNGKRFHQKSF